MGRSNYSVGHEAEHHAAQFLAKLGYTIRELNWKNRLCEIDIIVEHRKTIHFIEVKYRKNASHGVGLEYITPKKLSQMQFAAQMWVQEYGWNDEYVLGAIELTGEHFTVTNFLPSIL